MTHEWQTGGYFDPMDELEARRDQMIRDGYVPCSNPACNCGSWHRRDDEVERLRAALREIRARHRGLDEDSDEDDLDDCILAIDEIAKEALRDE